MIGVFGLADAAGALGAPCLITGWGLLAWGNHNLTALIAGMLVFDFGAQGAQISNQNKIYSLDPGARSRITAAYMVTYFLSGMLGSVIAGYAHQLSGWTAVCAAGAATATIGLTLWGLLHRLVERRNPTPGPKVVAEYPTHRS
jgi:predicted MFS family arabinose efflux permease